MYDIVIYRHTKGCKYFGYSFLQALLCAFDRICVNYTDAAWNLIQSVGAETYNVSPEIKQVFSEETIVYLLINWVTEFVWFLCFTWVLLWKYGRLEVYLALKSLVLSVDPLSIFFPLLIYTSISRLTIAQIMVA